MVVDLAVEGDHVAARRRDHRLMAGRGQIDDRQSRMAERQASVRRNPCTTVVGAAVPYRGGHACDRRAQRGIGHARDGQEKTAHPTHGSDLS